jgi:hypothetical protein
VAAVLCSFLLNGALALPASILSHTLHKRKMISAQANTRLPNGARAAPHQDGERGRLKPEEGDVMQDGGEGGSAVMAVEDTAELQIDVRMDVDALLCQACLLPLKPPIFKVSQRQIYLQETFYFLIQSHES